MESVSLPGRPHGANAAVRSASARRGFSLMEVMIVSAMMAVLVKLLADAMIDMGRPTAEAGASIRLLQEMDIAAVSLARDLGGSLPGDAAGAPAYGTIVSLERDNDGAALKINYDSDGDGTADTTVRYYVDAAKTDSDGVTFKTLVREQGSTAFTVARNIDAFNVDTPDAYRYRTITLTFKYPDRHAEEPPKFDPWNYKATDQEANRPFSTWVRQIKAYDPGA